MTKTTQYSPPGRVVITIDGLAGTGKSSLAAALAKRLGFIHLNSGILYRGIGSLLIESGASPSDEVALRDVLAKNTLVLKMKAERPVLEVNGQLWGRDLFTEEIGEYASKASHFKQVREFLLAAQRDAFPDQPMVTEGRDMGTVVFPSADLKFFVQVDEEVKAQRRLLQLQQGGRDVGVTLEGLRLALRERDLRDTERAESPTKPASDAEIIDNSHETLTSVVERMYNSAALRGLTS